MSRPTDTSIARAFWARVERYKYEHWSEAGTWLLAEEEIIERAAEFDAEIPAGTAQVGGPYCKHCGKETHHIGDVCFFCSKAEKAEKLTTSPERVQIPAESTHVRCPRCTASLPAGKTCGGLQCGLKEPK